MSPSIIVEEATFPSEGYALKGRVYRPHGEGKYPAVLICHGFPGNTKNMDLAETLALNSIVALVFYYRGAWGSGGDYSIAATAPSAWDALTYLKGLPFVDGKRIGVVSHSMGTMPNVATLRRDKTLKTGVFMGPVNDLSSWAAEPGISHMVAALTHSAEGRLTNYSGDRIKADLREIAETLNPNSNMGKVKCPVIMIVGGMDTITVPSECRKLFEKANEPKRMVEIEGSDHDFSEHRHMVIPEVLGWLKSHL